MDWFAAAMAVASIVGVFCFVLLMNWLIDAGLNVRRSMEDRGWPPLIAETVGMSISVGWYIYPALTFSGYALYRLFAGELP